MREQFRIEKVLKRGVLQTKNRLAKLSLGYSLALILLIGCGSATVKTIAVATVEPSPTFTQHPTFTPTARLSSSPTPSPTLLPTTTATKENTPTPTESLAALPTVTPTDIFTPTDIVTRTDDEPIVSDFATLQPLALSNVAESPPLAEANPVATIAAQLQEPIESTAQEGESGNSSPTQESVSIPPMPENLSPLPIVNAAPDASQISSEQIPTDQSISGQMSSEQIPSVPVLSDLGWDGVPRTTKVPILMYHYISTPPADADIYRKDLSVSPELFNAQLDRIHAEGYTTISLYDLLNYLMKGTSLPEKAVIITFDDGYRDNYENAFPALKAHGMQATFFVVMEFINAQRPEYMTWDMLREMKNGGMLVEAHGVDHRSLKNRDRDFLAFQALRSYETLQNELGQRARFISYPAGQYDQNTIEVFRSAGYWAGITTIQGATNSTDALFEFRRVRVRGTTSPDDLAALLATDW